MLTGSLFLRDDWAPGAAFNPAAARYYIADTESERPATATMGDLCFTKDTKKLWKWHDAQWNDSAGAANGSDPWTYLRLAADFTTSSATAVDVTGLGFAPTANTIYEIEARLMVRSATATVNPRPGWAWPTGLTDGVMEIHLAQTAAGGVLFAFGNINAALLIAVGGVPNNTQSWPCNYRGVVLAGASPSGTLRVQLASETAATVVRIVAGSFLRYRTVP